MKKLISLLLLLSSCMILSQDNSIPLVFSFQQQQGTYRVEAKYNAQATPEQKEAFNTELHKLGGEVMEKIKHLILNNKAILDMQGTHPIITLVCRWNNVEIKMEQP